MIKKLTRHTARNRMIPGIPSLYIISIKDKKTKADPVSFCMMVKAKGTKRRNATSRASLSRFMEKVYDPMTLDNANAVATLANSAGCR